MCLSSRRGKEELIKEASLPAQVLLTVAVIATAAAVPAGILPACPDLHIRDLTPLAGSPRRQRCRNLLPPANISPKVLGGLEGQRHFKRTFVNIVMSTLRNTDSLWPMQETLQTGGAKSRATSAHNDAPISDSSSQKRPELWASRRSAGLTGSPPSPLQGGGSGTSDSTAAA
jgi:hypothetical protein